MAFVIADPVGERSWKTREGADFFSAKHHVLALARAAGVALEEHGGASVQAGAGWQAGHCAAYGDIVRGWTAQAGLVNLALLKAHGIEGRVHAGCFAMLPEKLPAAAGTRRFSEFSLFPAALRDLALVVDENVPAGDARTRLLAAARAAAGDAFAVERVEVFDVYHGAGLPEGKKSLAFGLSFRSAARTLTDDEVNSVFQRTQDEIVRATGWQIRK